MNQVPRIKGWIAYLAVVGTVFVFHACAVEFDAQAETAAPARQA